MRAGEELALVRFLACGDEGEFESKMVFAVSSTPIAVGDELYFYYNAHKTTHYAKHEDRYGAIGLAKLRRDGFVSLHADGEGFLVTKPLVLDGSNLHVNAEIAGGLNVQILDERFEPCDGWQSQSLTAGGLDQQVCWPQGRALGELRDRPVRLKFIMRDVHLYSFWVD